jgi:hypothetical protein
MLMLTKKNPVDGIKWSHAITENTFNDMMSSQIDQSFKDWENGLHTETPFDEIWDKKCTGYSSLIFFPDASRWKDVVNDVWSETEKSPKYNCNAKDYLIVLELTIMRPESNYHFHIDVERKQFTGVCYWGKGTEGTLIKSGKQISQIGFKHNRCLWFSNVEEDLWKEDKDTQENEILPWHSMQNNSTKPRYTVNINYTPQSQVEKFLHLKRVQLIYWLKNKKPLWKPVGKK